MYPLGRGRYITRYELRIQWEVHFTPDEGREQKAQVPRHAETTALYTAPRDVHVEPNGYGFTPTRVRPSAKFPTSADPETRYSSLECVALAVSY